MPRKLKLNLKDLKVQSFVTSLTDEEKLRIKGGTGDCPMTWLSSAQMTLCANDCPTGDCCTGCNSYCTGDKICTC